MSTTVVRIQLDLPEDKVKELDELMEEADISTRKDLFNNALSLLVWVANQTKEGRIITSLDEQSGASRHLAMPILDNIARNVRKKQQRAQTAQTAQSF